MQNCLSLWLSIFFHCTFAIFCCGVALAQTRVDESQPASVDLLQLEETSIKAAVKRVSVSVVQIETIGGNARDAGVSTGTIVSADGLILTAAYNLRHKPTSIFVRAVSDTAQGPERFIATLLATDNSRNLCLLKADLPEDVTLTPAIAAPEDALLVGATTIAIGKVHDPRAASISVGIISATDRIWGRAVQTDAKISRSNYGGPLINLSGETIGILVPLSPEDSSVEAGAQWYDSGIGFAIPLESYYSSIVRLTQNTDLDQGLLGVTLDGDDLYADVPEIKFCAPRSPASECGLKPGDTILAIDDRPVTSQSQMKHVIGKKYAGDNISITILRNDRQETLTATLTDTIDPFVELAIGIIPDRNSAPNAATVAQVFADSPAEQSGLSRGDIISALNTEEIETWDDFQSAVNQLAVGETIEIVVRNESASNPSPAQTKTVELVPLSASLPPDDQEEVPGEEAGDDEASTSELVSIPIKVAGSANLCTAFLPEVELPRPNHGQPLLVWVAQPGIEDLQPMQEAVEQIAVRHGLVVLVPRSLNPQGWSPEEAEFIVKAIGKLKKRVKIDDRRIAIGGESTAAKMSCLAAFLNRETFHGLIMFNSLFPRRIPKIQTRPDQRLMILLAASDDFKQVDELEKMKSAIEKQKFPINRIRSQDSSLAKMLPQIAAWIDVLDRH